MEMGRATKIGGGAVKMKRGSYRVVRRLVVAWVCTLEGWMLGEVQGF